VVDRELRDVLSQQPGLVFMCRTIAEFHKVPDDLAVALVYVESRFDPGAESECGAKGLCQLMPETAREVGVDPTCLFNPVDNLNGGFRYLRKLYDRIWAYTQSYPYATDRFTAEDNAWRLSLAAYNGGYGWLRAAFRLGQQREGADWKTPGAWQGWPTVRDLFHDPGCVITGKRGNKIARAPENVVQVCEYVDGVWEAYEILRDSAIDSAEA
jgi:hypothetical protein